MTNDLLLFSPLQMRDVILPNRVVLSPLCMYSAHSGVASEWQFAHLSTFARGAVGLVFTEATAVEPRGRITPRCLGIWTDEQAEALKPITGFIESMGSVPGIQIAHAHVAPACGLQNTADWRTYRQRPNCTMSNSNPRHARRHPRAAA